MLIHSIFSNNCCQLIYDIILDNAGNEIFNIHYCPTWFVSAVQGGLLTAVRGGRKIKNLKKYQISAVRRAAPS